MVLSVLICIESRPDWKYHNFEKIEIHASVFLKWTYFRRHNRNLVWYQCWRKLYFRPYSFIYTALGQKAHSNSKETWAFYLTYMFFYLYFQTTESFCSSIETSVMLLLNLLKGSTQYFHVSHVWRLGWTRLWRFMTIF